jgi:uncharacterized damage-inducible protein DinB
MNMNQRLAEIVNYLEDVRAVLLKTVGGLSSTEAEKSPGPGEWSVVEILHHLYLGEAGVSQLLEKQVERAGKKGIGPDLENESLLTSLDRFSLERVTTKINAPPQTVPQQGIEMSKMLELLKNGREKFLEIISRASAYNLSELSFPHPAMGKVNMYQWILFVGKHETRHIHQIEDVLKRT